MFGVWFRPLEMLPVRWKVNTRDPFNFILNLPNLGECKMYRVYNIYSQMFSRLFHFNRNFNNFCIYFFTDTQLYTAQTLTGTY